MGKNRVLKLVVREAELWLLKAMLWLKKGKEEDAKTAIRIGMIVIEVFRREIELYNELLIQEKLIGEHIARVRILYLENIHEEYDNEILNLMIKLVEYDTEILDRKDYLYNRVLQEIR